uniref:(northern house mosquito) hypothetical protein n=1 Tax=Culex pipiens TaxID=7175 RepID=A0A8D8L1C0_CULPI
MVQRRPDGHHDPATADLRDPVHVLRSAAPFRRSYRLLRQPRGSSATHGPAGLSLSTVQKSGRLLPGSGHAGRPVGGCAARVVRPDRVPGQLVGPRQLGTTARRSRCQHAGTDQECRLLRTDQCPCQEVHVLQTTRIAAQLDQPTYPGCRALPSRGNHFLGCPSIRSTA